MNEELPWVDRKDVNIGTGEFVNQYTLNRNLNKLLENDVFLKSYIDDTLSSSVSGILENASFDFEYVPVTIGTNPLYIEQQSNINETPYTYNIADFKNIVNGTDLVNQSNIRSIYVEVYSDVDFNAENQEIYIKADFPNDTNPHILLYQQSHTPSDSEALQSSTVEVPINKGQITFTLYLKTTANFDNGAKVYFKIVGVKQLVLTSNS
jgi:hypothetical protein